MLSDSLYVIRAEMFDYSFKIVTEVNNNMFHILLILICACSVRSCDEPGCLCEAPDVDKTTVQPTYLVRKIIGDSSISWEMDVNITWAAPLNTSNDYALELTAYTGGTLRCFDQMSNQQPNLEFSIFICPIRFSQQHITTELYTEKNILFGHRYILDISLYNATSNALAPNSICINDLFSPDCYEVTQDESYCRNQPIVTSGKPVNASLSHFTIGSQDTIVAVIVWDDPIQLNGNITGYFIETYNVDTNKREDEDPNLGTMNEKRVPGLLSLQQYRVDITPTIDVGQQFVKNGLTAEVMFTTPSTSSLTSITMSSSITGVTPNETLMVRTSITMSSSITGVTPNETLMVRTEDSLRWIIIGGSIAIVVVIILLIMAVVWYRRRYQRMNQPYVPNLPSIPPKLPRINSREKDYMRDVDPIFKNKEVSRGRVEIGELLGSGQYGVVYRGTLQGSAETSKHPLVAVKTVKDDVSDNMKHDFLSEIRLMIEIGTHPHVMEVIACCTAQPPYYMITQLIKYGDLLHFLRKCNKPEHIQNDPIYDITDLQRCQIAWQIASGMIFISSKRFYHGDLAARNILVGSGLIVKISDFGLSSDIYQKGYQRLSADRNRPVKWASIETNLDGKCTIQSDVWSYGVVLYEIYTNGRVPYKDMDGREVIRRVRDGYRMEKPDNCPDDVYKLMLLCWHKDPISRPPFKNLLDFFDKRIESTTSSPYLDVSNDMPSSEEPATASKIRKPDSRPDNGSAALSGESVNFHDWEFERKSSSKDQADVNKDSIRYSHFNPDGLMYERYKDSDKTG